MGGRRQWGEGSYLGIIHLKADSGRILMTQCSTVARAGLQLNPAACHLVAAAWPGASHLTTPEPLVSNCKWGEGDDVSKAQGVQLEVSKQEQVLLVLEDS